MWKVGQAEDFQHPVCIFAFKKFKKMPLTSKFLTFLKSRDVPYLMNIFEPETRNICGNGPWNRLT